MFVNQAIMVLYNDEIHDLCKILVKDCKEIDDDQYGKIQTDQLVEIFKQVICLESVLEILII